MTDVMKYKKGCPNSKNEHSLFEKELSLKLEEFRLARSKWLAFKKEDQIITANINEGVNESNVYRGRCVCLRKIGFKTNKVREHYQTVKPLRYFTLKPKLSYNDVGTSKRGTKRDNSLWNQQHFGEQEYLEDQLDESIKLKDKKREQIWEEKEREIGELAAEKLNENVPVKEQEKKKKKRRGPSQKAIENLKASREASALVETCRCNNGKEVTVVIKGFCLCDKKNLKKFKLNKISDDISKLNKSKPEVDAEESKLHLTDSIEFHKKQMQRRLKWIEEDVTEEETEDQKQQGFLRTNAKKTVSFVPQKNTTEMIMQLEKNEQKKERGEPKEGKEKRKGQEEEKDHQETKQGQNRKGDEQKTDEEMSKKEKEKKEPQTREERHEDRMRELEEEKKRSREQEEREKTQNKENEKRKKKDEKDLKKEERKANAQDDLDDAASVISLFHNKTPKESDLALTKEQFEKLKRTK